MRQAWAQRHCLDGRTQIDGQRLSVSLQLKAYGYGQLIQVGTPALRAKANGEGGVMHEQWGQTLREQPKPPLPAHRAWPSPLPKPNPFTLQLDLALAVPCLYPNLRSGSDACPHA